MQNSVIKIASFAEMVNKDKTFFSKSYMIQNHI